MRLLRRVMLIIAFLCMTVGSSSTVNAEYSHVRYVPTPMSSVDAAIAAFNELKGFIKLGNLPIRELSVDEIGFHMLAVDEGVKVEEKKYWVGGDRITIPNNVPYRDEYNMSFAFNQFKYMVLVKDETNNKLVVGGLEAAPQVSIDNIAHISKLGDAILTLALAQNAVIRPYFGVSLDNDGAKSTINALKAAKVPAGAVVFYGPGISEPGNEIMANVVFSQATYGGKTFPIISFESWYAVCQEVLTGKSEATLSVKVIRNGVAMNKDVKVFNLGFGVKVPKSNPAATQSQTTPPKGFGIALRPLGVEEVKTLGLDNANGFMVIGVQNGSAADLLQIKPNDVLLAVNGVDITSAAQLQDLMTKGSIKTVKVSRVGNAIMLEAPLIF